MVAAVVSAHNAGATNTTLFRGDIVMAMQHAKKTERQKITLIYDGDVGPDSCDFAVLSLLHEYQRHVRGHLPGGRKRHRDDSP